MVSLRVSLFYHGKCGLMRSGDRKVEAGAREKKKGKFFLPCGRHRFLVTWLFFVGNGKGWLLRGRSKLLHFKIISDAS